MDDIPAHDLHPAIRVLENGAAASAYRLQFHNRPPRDQTQDAADHMRYAATLGLPKLTINPGSLPGRAIVVGGAPSVKDYLDQIRLLAADPDNAVFALNWTHNWLIANGIVPHGCVMMEIDADPCQILDHPHPDVTYYIASLCFPQTFIGLEGYRRVLWHAGQDEEKQERALAELFPGDTKIGGGCTTFTRTLNIALVLGYRSFDLFGVDSSFPLDAKSTHVEGYPADTTPKADGIEIWAKNEDTGMVRNFRTVGYLAQQAEQFRLWCRTNHPLFRMRVHGDGLLRFIHEQNHPEQYQ
jgi:hypothetical protein